MTNSLSSFVSRHRRKLIFLGVSTTLISAIYFYFKRVVTQGLKQVEEFSKAMEKSMLLNNKKSKIYENLKKQKSEILATFLLTVSNVVKGLTDPKPVTEKLKVLRGKTGKNEKDDGKSKIEMQNLWQELKVISTSRGFANVYAVCILNAIVAVQATVVGRYFLEDNEEGDKTSEKEKEKNNYNLIKEKVLLLTTQFFLDGKFGMKLLVEKIKSGVATASAAWNMGTAQSVTKEEVIDLVNSVRSNVESNSKQLNQWLKICILDKKLLNNLRQTVKNQLIADNSDNVNDILDNNEKVLTNLKLMEENEEKIVKVMEEVVDMLETPLFVEALKESFDQMFDQMRSVLNKKFSPAKDADNTTLSDKEEKFMLAKVIVTLLKDVAQDIMEQNLVSTALAEKNIPSLQNLIGQIFYGQDGENGNDLGADLDLSSLGLQLSQDELKSLKGLLSGDESEMMNMLQSLGGSDLMNILKA